MKQAPWILCAILFVVLLYQLTCRTKRETVPKSEYEAMVKQKEDTVKYYDEVIKADDAAIVTATAHAVESAEQAAESEAKVAESQDVIKRLNAKIDAAKKEKPSDRFIPMSPGYIEGCDSLQLATEYQDIQINKHKRDNAALKADKEREIATRDTALANRAKFNLAIQKQLDTCHAKVKEKETAKVKNQWFGVVGLTGNKINPLGGGEAGIMVINGKGVLYGVKGEILAGQLWVGVKTGVRLFK